MASQSGDRASNTASASSGGFSFGSTTPHNQTNPHATRSIFGSSTPQNPFVASSSPFGAAPQNQTAPQTTGATSGGLFGRPNPQTPTNPQTTSSPFRFFAAPAQNHVFGHPNFQDQTAPQTTGSTKPSPSPNQAQTTPQPATISDNDAAAIFCFPDGDLNIFVTYQGKSVVGKVSSAAMCLASRVFKKFIFPVSLILILVILRE